jgi:hypothetical protein
MREHALDGEMSFSSIRRTEYGGDAAAALRRRNRAGKCIHSIATDGFLEFLYHNATVSSHRRDKSNEAEHASNESGPNR